MLLRDVGALATAAGVAVGAYQLWLGRKQARTDFEDSLVSAYREIVSSLPVEALLDEPLSDDDLAALLKRCRGVFYRYFDLTNEQVFLRQEGRVSPRTWENWRDGISHNLHRNAFHCAWHDIEQNAQKDFQELRKLLRSDFGSDPRHRRYWFFGGHSVAAINADHEKQCWCMSWEEPVSGTAAQTG
jgi:hypothetical protein